jgi:hypothetical protein
VFCKHIYKDPKEIFKNLDKERKAQAKLISDALANEAGLPTDLFM